MFETLSVGDFTPTKATLKAARDDEAWFKNHQRRTFRLRRAVPDEFPSPATHVLCAKSGPGVIVRHSFVSSDDPPNTDVQGECLWQMWGNEPLSPKYGPMVAEFKRQEC